MELHYYKYNVVQHLKQLQLNCCTTSKKKLNCCTSLLLNYIAVVVLAFTIFITTLDEHAHPWMFLKLGIARFTTKWKIMI